MAAGRIILPCMPALDRNGDPVSGALLYFYQNLTTTLKAVYADAGLTTPLTNPVVSDSAGQFPSIFADSTEAYSARGFQPNGVALPRGAWDDVQASVEQVVLLNDPIVGLGMSNNVSLPNTAIDISSGSCNDKTGFVPFNLQATLTKRLDVAWAAGSGQGGLDTGAVAASTFYNLFLIYNPSTLVLDGLFSTSFNNPVLPAGYTSSRYIGSVKTDGASAILAFVNVGEWFWFKSSFSDVSATANDNSLRFRTLSVPKGCKARASIQVVCAGSITAFLWFRDPDRGTYSPLGPTGAYTVRFAGTAYVLTTLEVETDTTGRIYTSSSSNLGDETITIVTNGWAVDRSVYR